MVKHGAFSRLARVSSCVTVLVILVALAASFSLPGVIATPSYVAYDNITKTLTVAP